jgi:hypothetical protein
MRLVRNGQILDSIALEDIFMDEHDSIGGTLADSG